MAIELNVPTVFDDQQVRQWAARAAHSRHVRSVFASLQTQLVGHGRAPGDVPAVPPERFVEHAARVREAGLEFLYLLNGLCRHLNFDDRATRARFFDELDWILVHVEPDVLVISDPRVARLVRSAYGPDEVAIRVSTIAGVRKPSDLLPWLDFGLDGVVLHHDVGRDFQALAELAEFVADRAPHVGLELLVNESCLANCFARRAHYARLAATTLDYTEGFQQTCNIPRFLDPAKLLEARWIRPEDLDQYACLGVSRFKIAGREMSNAWLDRCVRAYLEGRHVGNLFELFTMTPPGLDVEAADIVILDNPALGGFLADLRVAESSQDQVCRRWTADLWRDSRFRINDPGARYVMTSEGPRCVEPGRYLRALIRQLNVRDQVFRRVDLTSSVEMGLAQ